MKRDLIIDFDNTLVDSSKRIYDMYFEKYPERKNNSIFSNHDLKWNFLPYVSSEEGRKECLSYFTDPQMYEKLNWVDNYTEDTLRNLSKKYNIIVCSKRDKYSYTPVVDWLEKHMPCEYQTCFVSTYDKGMVGRNGSIIIDDKIECLGGNDDRFIKILFGDWGYQLDDFHSLTGSRSKNIEGDFIRILDWYEIMELLK